MGRYNRECCWENFLLYELPILPDFDIEDDRPDQEAQLLEKEVWDLIKKNLDELNPKQRFVIEHRYLSDIMTFKQIAAELKISIQYASKLEKLALKKLKAGINVH